MKQYNHIEDNNRIARNTLMLYFRMLFSMVISLYTSRVVLQALGVEDYGIYNVVGGLVGMFSLISTSLSSAVSRFLTFELGKGNNERLRCVFSTSVLIHIILAIIVFVAMETLGLWFLNNKMTIPDNRLYASNWVFQSSMLAFMMNLISVPYTASIVAHEKMGAFAYIGILEVILKLLVVLFVANLNFQLDRLIIYSLLLLLISMSLCLVYIIYCQRHFNECHFVMIFNKSLWKEMSFFAGWNFIGCAASLFKGQGVNILLNQFYGPILNAARGITSSVNSAITSFAYNFTSAINPQITKSYASEDYSYMFSLIYRGSRFSYYILFVFALPVIIETDFLLKLWLGDFPNHTINFIRLSLLVALNDVLSNTLITAQNATGRIRNYQIVVGGTLLMNFPLTYLCLKVGLPPESYILVALLISFCCLLLRLFFLRGSINLSIKTFLNKVYLNVLLVSLIGCTPPLLIYMCLDPGYIRFLLVLLVSVITSSFSILYVGCSSSERNHILSKLMEIKSKFSNDRHC